MKLLQQHTGWLAAACQRPVQLASGRPTEHAPAYGTAIMSLCRPPIVSQYQFIVRDIDSPWRHTGVTSFGVPPGRGRWSSVVRSHMDRNGNRMTQCGDTVGLASLWWIWACGVRAETKTWPPFPVWRPRPWSQQRCSIPESDSWRVGLKLLFSKTRTRTH